MTKKLNEKKDIVKSARSLAVLAALAGGMLVIRPQDVKAAAMESEVNTVPHRVKAVRETLANKWAVIKQDGRAEGGELTYGEHAITTLWGNWGNWGNWNNWRNWNNWDNWKKWTNWGDFSDY